MLSSLEASSKKCGKCTVSLQYPKYPSMNANSWLYSVYLFRLCSWAHFWWSVRGQNHSAYEGMPSQTRCPASEERLWCSGMRMPCDHFIENPGKPVALRPHLSVVVELSLEYVQLESPGFMAVVLQISP